MLYVVCYQENHNKEFTRVPGYGIILRMHYLEFVLSQLVCKSVTRRHQRRGLCLSAQQLVGEEIQSCLVPADWMLLINAMLLLNHTDFLYSLAQRKLVGTYITENIYF